MCGIVGALSFSDSSFAVTEPYITRMRDSMSHRGPDGVGTWISDDQRVGLGHRRLAIIDLSDAAAQPMSNQHANIWLSFNGEIYNHREIRVELEKLGKYHWQTDHSDTEVIVHAFEEWGIDCVHRFRGMFAFALWDARSRELWLVRDRIGVKPLCYSVHHGRIVFASEIKALLRDPDQTRAVDEEAFFHYLTFMTAPAPNTLFRGVRKLAPGTWLRVRENGDVHEHRYWDVLDHTTPLVGLSDDEIAERVLAELRTAVALRKISDVPVGVFLSGGIDSSTNAALFSNGDRQPVRTFSIGYKGNYQSYRNELHYARRMADEVHADHHERLLDVDDLIDFLPRMVHLQDEPIGDPVCVPVYYVSQLAREHGVTVCQVGEGADELFWGYPSWKRMLKLQQLSDRVPLAWVKSAAVKALALHPTLRDNIRLEWLRRAGDGVPVFWSGMEGFTEIQKRRLLHPRLRKKFEGLTSWEAIRATHERFERKAWEPSSLNWMSYADLNLRLPELLLMRVDKMSMGVSLEGRVPFLDHKFVELAFSIPSEVKTRNGTLKYVLKKAVRGVIPDEMIDRTKQGFSVPVYEWFFGRLGEQMRRELDAFCKNTEFFDAKEVSALMDRGRGAQAWYLLNFALWHKHWFS
jgi:asparagine synthase (glutamine-hydrolysing)